MGMKETSKIQIQNIKNDYNFGVEVEMNHITREDAAKLAATFFGTNHYEFTGEGYSIWTAWDASGRKWKFAHDCSIVGPKEQRCELVTPILEYADIEMLQDLIVAAMNEALKAVESAQAESMAKYTGAMGGLGGMGGFGF